MLLPSRPQVSPSISVAQLSVPPAESPQTADPVWNSYQFMLWRRVMARRPDGMHLSGEATLRFTLDANGAIVDADIARSSGNRMIDRLALRTLRSVSPFPAPPEEIQDRDLSFTIGFRFNK
ncbi:hypothetical protein NT2_04_02260 [Caenibius tardaugens NBRC 16725]|uniref:TonB C-terminal domain-containing protein n=1 Tax=Caenibius tardaugens NBRC 16725 TaxID=1219035 RepID=U2ZTY2_9SPHN|nr:hypothetical protein NT2_04_02260 [Caenibius tardaugens NBRC 16725]